MANIPLLTGPQSVQEQQDKINELILEINALSSFDKTERLTQTAYDALTPPDPNTLYVIVG